MGYPHPLFLFPSNVCHSFSWYHSQTPGYWRFGLIVSNELFINTHLVIYDFISTLINLLSSKKELRIKWNKIVRCWICIHLFRIFCTSTFQLPIMENSSFSVLYVIIIFVYNTKMKQATLKLEFHMESGSVWPSKLTTVTTWQKKKQNEEERGQANLRN